MRPLAWTELKLDAAGMVRNIEREAAALLRSDRYVTPSPAYPRLEPGHTVDDALKAEKQYHLTERHWHGEIGACVVRALRFTGTGWGPTYDELAVAVAKWALSAMRELAARDAALDVAEQHAAELGDRVGVLVVEASKAARAHAQQVADLERQRQELRERLAAQAAELLDTQRRLHAAEVERDAALSRERAALLAAEASRAAAMTTQAAMETLRAALRIPGPSNPRALEG